MKIARIICQILRVPTSHQRSGSRSETLLVRVQTEDGLEGVGETDALPEAVKAVIDAPPWHTEARGLRDALLGQNPLETARLWRIMQAAIADADCGSGAMAAIDIALWDLQGKLFKQPIHRLLGGRMHERIRACVGLSFGHNAEETQAMARRGPKAGYQAVELGGELTGHTDLFDRELARGGRDGVGAASLLVDARRAWDMRTALRRAQSFTEFRVECLENPLHADDAEAYAWLRDHSPIPIAAGANRSGRAAFRPFIDRRAADIYQVDLGRNGFTDAAFIRGRVEEIGGRLGSPCVSGPIIAASTLHWLATCHDPFFFQERGEDSPLRYNLVQERIQADEGWTPVPDAPGLGITLNESCVAQYLVAESGK